MDLNNIIYRNKNSMKVLAYLKGIRRYMLVGFLSGMTSSFLTSYATIFHTKITSALLTNDNTEIFNFMILFYSYSFIGNVLAGIRGFIFTTYIQIFSSRIKKDILLSFFEKNILSFSNRSPSEIADILIEDSNSVADLYCLNANVALRDFANFMTILYILLPISVELFLLNTGLVIFQIVLEHNYQTHIYEKSIDKCNKVLLSQKEMIHDYTHKTDTYKSLGMEKTVLEKWQINDQEYTTIKRREALFYGLKVILNQSINHFMILILIIFGIWRNIPNSDIMIFMIYNPSVCEILRTVIYIRTDITKRKKSYTNVKDVFQTIKKDDWNGSYIPNDIQYTPIVKLKNLSFSYCDNKTVLENINLTFDSNNIYGIKGKSGRGKSTLLKIILGLYKPTDGEVTFDDIKLRDFDKKYFFSKIISYVGQEPVLLDGSTMENITASLQDYDHELLEKLKLLIQDIPEHIKMSGGQRQRVAICRALIRKPKVLLLDEPTSALDSINEGYILNMIKEIQKVLKMTVIIVSHKDSTLQICDKIIHL
jgi:ABC-type bacteriocin/lantibiotic exporter with double-glycine peptidase domain